MVEIQVKDIKLILKDHEDEALILLDQGLQFGIGFFETIWIGHKPNHLSAHVDRLNNSLRTFSIDKVITEACLLQFIKLHRFKEVVLKIVVTEKNVLAFVRLNPYQQLQYEEGFSLQLSPVIRGRFSLLVRHKSMNYAECLYAKKKAIVEGFDDAFFLNEAGSVTETSTANLFIIEKNALITPGIEEGLLPGIIRAEVLKQFSVIQERITYERLILADGVFITNSVLGVMPVKRIDGHAIPHHKLTTNVLNSIQNCL